MTDVGVIVHQIPLGPGMIVLGTITDAQDDGSSTISVGVGKTINAIFVMCTNAERAMAAEVDTTTASTAVITADTNDDDGIYMAFCDMVKDLASAGFDRYSWGFGTHRIAVGELDNCSSSGSAIATGLTNVYAAIAQNRTDTENVKVVVDTTRGQITCTTDTNNDEIYWMAVGD